MNNKVYTLSIDEKELESQGSKTKVTKKNKAQDEIETFGIVEINNTSAKKRVKNVSDKGYTKTVSAVTKKSVKKSPTKVDDYFNFDFRYNENSKANEPASEEVSNISRAVKKGGQAKSKEEKISVAIAALKGTEEQVVANTEVLNDNDISAVSSDAESCSSFALDDAALHIIDIARLGSFFG